MKKILSSKALRIACLVLLDSLAVVFAEFFSFFIRMEFNTSTPDFDEHFEHLLSYLPIAVVLTVCVFALLRLYNSLWQFASVYEYSLITLGTTCSFVINTIMHEVLEFSLPRSCYPMS